MRGVPEGSGLILRGYENDSDGDFQYESEALSVGTEVNK